MTEGGEETDPHAQLSGCKNYNIEGYLKEFTKTQQTFSCFLWNARSFSAKFDDFEIFLDQLKTSFSIIAINETWFTPQDPVHAFNLENMTLYVCNRLNRIGGGVALYISNEIEHRLRTDINLFNGFESLFLEVKSPISPKPIIIGTVYRPPALENVDQFNHALENLFTLGENEGKQIIFLGDTNFDVISPRPDHDTQSYSNLLASHAYRNLNSSLATRRTDFSATNLDHIFTNLPRQSSTGIFESYGQSDHYPVFVHFEHKLPKIKPVLPSTNIPDFDKFNHDDFSNKFSTINWEDLFSDKSAADCYTLFMRKFEGIYTECLPMKRIRKNNAPRKPWITPGIVKSIKQRDKLCKAYHSDENLFALDRYRVYRNRLTKIIVASKNIYYVSTFQELLGKNDSRGTWKLIKRAMNNGEHTPKIIPEKLVDKNGSESSSTHDMSNTFAKFYADVGKDLDARLPPLPPGGSCFMDYMGRRSDKSHFLKPVLPSQIRTIITKLDDKKAPGIDKIHAKIIKKHSDLIVKPLAILFNKCFAEGVFPNEMKIAKITPLFKKGDKSDPANYRGISLLSLFSKMLEKLINTRLLDALSHLINPNQFGFQKNTSTEHALIQVVEKLKSAMDSNKLACCVNLDLAKAFQTVNHRILLSKLEHLGIRGRFLRLLTSYLTHRKLCVDVSGAISEMYDIVCGVPEGSVLGPTLFLFYVNDIKNVSDEIDCHQFADDTNLLYVSPTKSLPSMQRVMNRNLYKYYTWFCLNRLTVNPTKTEIMVVRGQTHQLGIENFDLTLCGIQIKPINAVKYLGVLVDDKLNFKAHIAALTAKLSRNVGVIRKLSKCVPNKILRNVSFALVYSHLTYCVLIWGINYDTTLRPIQIVLNRLIRVLYSGPAPDTLSTIEKFAALNLRDLRSTVDYHMAIHVFDFIHGNLPIALRNMHNSLINTHYHATRNSATGIFQPRVRSTLGQHSVSFHGPLIWNEITAEIREIDCERRDFFKKMLKLYFKLRMVFEQ